MELQRQRVEHICPQNTDDAIFLFGLLQQHSDATNNIIVPQIQAFMSSYHDYMHWDYSMLMFPKRYHNEYIEFTSEHLAQSEFKTVRYAEGVTALANIADQTSEVQKNGTDEVMQLTGTVNSLSTQHICTTTGLYSATGDLIDEGNYLWCDENERHTAAGSQNSIRIDNTSYSLPFTPVSGRVNINRSCILAGGRQLTSSVFVPQTNNIMTFLGHCSFVSSVCNIHKGHVSGSYDKTVKIYDHCARPRAHTSVFLPERVQFVEVEPINPETVLAAGFNNLYCIDLRNHRYHAIPAPETILQLYKSTVTNSCTVITCGNESQSIMKFPLNF
ncbi:hypothetical protein PCE1_001680 [Barthelona sp. PCE]